MKSPSFPPENTIWAEETLQSYLDEDERLLHLTGRTKHFCTDPCDLYTDESVKKWIEAYKKDSKKFQGTYKYFRGIHSEYPGTKWYKRVSKSGEEFEPENHNKLLIKTGIKCKQK